jgi:hypothetical protein
MKGSIARKLNHVALAAKRRKNAAHAVRRGWKVENDRAPEGRKKSSDTHSEKATEVLTRHGNLADTT